MVIRRQKTGDAQAIMYGWQQQAYYSNLALAPLGRARWGGVLGKGSRAATDGRGYSEGNPEEGRIVGWMKVLAGFGGGICLSLCGEGGY